jgi:hypothetical protein
LRNWIERVIVRWAHFENQMQVVTGAYGYGPTREAAMAAFAKSWRRE